MFRTDPEIRVWNVSTGKVLHVLHDGLESDLPRSIVFSADNAWLASNNGDKTIQIWDVATGHRVRKLTARSRHVLDLVFSPQSDRLVGIVNNRVWGSVSEKAEHSLHLWDLKDKEDRARIVSIPDVQTVAFAPDGETLVWSCCHRTVGLVDWKSGEELPPAFSGAHLGGVSAVAYSADGKWIATGSDDYTVRLWDPVTSKPLWKSPVQPHPIRALALSPDGRWLVIGHYYGPVTFWDLKTKAKKQVLAEEVCATRLTFSPDGTLLAGFKESGIQFWNIESGKQLTGYSSVTESGQAQKPVGVGFSANGRRLALGFHHEICVRSIPDDQIIFKRTFDETLQSLALSPDGRTLAIATDKKKCVFEVLTGEQRGHIGSITDQIRSIVFSSNSRFLAFGGWDGRDVMKSLPPRDLATGRELVSLQGHRFFVNDIAFSPDGRKLATASGDTTVLVWELPAR